MTAMDEVGVGTTVITQTINKLIAKPHGITIVYKITKNFR